MLLNLPALAFQVASSETAADADNWIISFKLIMCAYKSECKIEYDMCFGMNIICLLSSTPHGHALGLVTVFVSDYQVMILVIML